MSPIVGGLIGGVCFFVAVYLAASFSGIVRVALLYQAILFGLFYGLYMAMPKGFAANFNTPDNKKLAPLDVLYYTTVTHTTVGYGDIYPKTTYARMIVSAHLGLVYLGALLPFLSSS